MSHGKSPIAGWPQAWQKPPQQPVLCLRPSGQSQSTATVCACVQCIHSPEATEEVEELEDVHGRDTALQLLVGGSTNQEQHKHHDEADVLHAATTIPTHSSTAHTHTQAHSVRSTRQRGMPRTAAQAPCGTLCSRAWSARHGLIIPPCAHHHIPHES